MKAKINYRSKKTIIIISVAVVLLIAAIVGTVAFVKGNQDAAAAMTDDGTSTSQNDGANAGLPNNGDQNNGDDQNNNGTTLPEVGDNTNPADSNNNGNNGSTTNGGTTGTNGANGSNTGANAGTTTGTTTTGNNGANVPNQDYTQTTVIPGRDNVLVEQNTEIGWSPISVAAYTAASKLKVHKPDLDLQKYAYLDGDSLEELPVNTAVQKGETITYVIKITNNGNEDANGIRTIDSIPEGTELASISEGGALNNDGKIVWKNDIKAGKTVTVSFKVVVTADSIDLINNIAKVNGEETPETKTPVITANKTAQVVTIVDKEEVLENRDAKVGETIRYTITAKNTTEVDGTTVIKDSIPDGTSFVDGTITEKGNFDKENGTITWNNVVVPAKGEVSVSFDVVVNEKTAAGEVVKSISNTATIGNTSTEEVETKVANITGEKEVSDKVANVGDTLTYTIILTNNGNGDGKVTVTDAIPKGTKIKVATTDGYDLETNTMTWKNVEVKAGKSVELTLEVVVEDNISIIKNTAYVDGNKIPEEPETSVKHHYTVEHYTENLDGTYSKVEKDTVVSEDVEIGTKVSYKINNYDGFTFDESKTENKDATVPDNNNLVVKLYYTRNSYKVTYEYEGKVPTGASALPTEKTYKYGASVTVAENATAPGYTFSGWDHEDFTMPASDVVIKGSFTANDNTQYKVEHYLEDLDGEKFTLKDTETLEGTTDTTATAEPKTYEGFTFDSTVDGTKTSGTITGDGKLVLKLYYTRNSYKVTYKYEGTVPTGASELPAEATYKYGESVTVAEDATAPGYTFSGWDKKDFTMPANDVVIKGSFAANDNTQYKVEHYLEDLDGKTFTLKDTETLEGTTDTTATAEPKTYEGFTFDSTVDGTKTSGTITGDGKLVLKLYYTRNSYKVTYKYEGTVPTGASESPAEATYKYGESVTVAEDATAPGYTFSGWDKKDFTMPANDVVIKGSFAANDNTQYKVEHYLEDLDGKTFTLKDTETLEGTTDTTATAEPKTYEGFTFDSTVDGTKTSGTITGDGQLVLKLYYTRNSYKVTYKYEGTVPTGASESPAEATYKYGESVTVAEDATAPGYTFSGWDKKDFTMPANDVVIKGSFAANDNTQYKVEHYLEDLDGKTFTLKDTETLEGTTDTTATATPKQYPGFTYDSTVEGTKTSGTITGDGKLVLKLYYTRNSYKVTYKYEGTVPTGASELPAEATYKYGESVTVAEDATAPGYTFSGWDKKDFTMPANDVVIKGSFAANDNTQYKVEHYLEDLDGKTFTLKDTETLEGTTDTTATATPKQYPGFTFDSTVDGTKTSGTITGDGQLVLKLYYTRNSYKVTYKYEGTVPTGASESPAEATYKYGESVTVAEDATAPGYTFSGWDKKDFTMPANDVVIKGSFAANDNTQYKVEHYLEDLDGKTFTLKDTETLEGTTDTTATAEPKTYEGFTFDSTVDGTKTSGTITGDGKLVLKLYYTRNSYKVTYKYEGTVPTGASESPAEATYKYGESVTVAEDATAPGYTFSGWDHEDFTMPASDVVIKGSFTANDNTQYKVEHYLEDLDGEKFTLKDTETLEGTTDTTATAEPKTYEGFTFDSTVDGTKTSGTITGDGKLVLKLYYTRNSYKVTYKYEGTVPTGASELPAEATYKYGESVTVAEDATAPGYTFSGWDKKDFTMPANDVVIKGSFAANDNTQYKVEHYLEDLDDKTFTLKDTETLAGTTDTTATATPKQYPGFTYDSTVEGTKTSGTITGDGQLVLKLYYTRNTYKYTVHYFYNGVEDKDKADEFEALYEEKINEYTIKNQGIYTEYNKESSNRTKEALLVIGTGSNYINIYYGTPNVTISKKVNKTTAKVGDTLHYTIIVKETRGFVDASGVNVTDPISEGLENVRNITHNGNLNEGNVEWNNLAITKNSSITLEFDATVSANTIGKTISNTANLGGSTNGDSNTVTTTVSELKAAVKEVKKGTTGKDAVNIVLVMDLSYSMKSNKTSDGVTRLDAAKTAATKFINSIYTKDPESKVTVTVLTFNTANPLTTIKYVGTERCTNNNIWHQHWNCKNIDGVWYSKWEEQKVAIPYSGTSKLGFADKTNYGALVNEINHISLPDKNPDEGLGTNVSAALDLTKTTIGDLEDNHSENSNVVILLSDGAPSKGYDGYEGNDNKTLINKASEIKGNPITTEFYSIQFGTENGAYDLLKAMSSNNAVYTSNSIDSLVENFTNILDQNTTKDPIDTVNGKYTTTLSNPLVVDADNPITVTYEGTTLFTCTSLPNNGLTYDSTTKTITWDINAWNAVEGHTKVTTNDIVIQCYVER